MKAITIILIFAALGCTKDCPECFSFAEPLRLAILNNQGENLLDTNKIDGLEIKSLTLASGLNINYVIKDTGIQSIPIGFWHLESIDERFFDSCIDQDSEFYITYTNSSEIDTINVLIVKVTTESNDGCKCTGYTYRNIKHNKSTITEFENEHTGAAIIRK